MARDDTDDFTGPVRRLLVALLVMALLAVMLIWRIDSPRVERFRARVVDRVVPPMETVMAPVAGIVTLITDFRSYQALRAQNEDLRRELQQMKAWREAAVQLEQQNAKLLDLNKLKLDPKLTYISGIVMADSGSPFRQSVLLNVGARDGVRDGWPVMDGIGLVGRLTGLGRNTARVLLLTDTTSRIPVTVQRSGQRAVLAGTNSDLPLLEFLDDAGQVRPGDRVVSSGDGGVFPADLLVGEVVQGRDRRLRVRLAADYERLEFLRILRASEAEQIDAMGGLILPQLEMQGPPAPPPAVGPGPGAPPRRSDG